MGWRVTPGKWAAGLGRERGNGALSAVAENGAEIYAAGKHGLGPVQQDAKMSFSFKSKQDSHEIRRSQSFRPHLIIGNKSLDLGSLSLN
jgi:hypothetical protein